MRSLSEGTLNSTFESRSSLARFSKLRHALLFLAIDAASEQHEPRARDENELAQLGAGTHVVFRLLPRVQQTAQSMLLSAFPASWLSHGLFFQLAGQALAKARTAGP